MSSTQLLIVAGHPDVEVMLAPPMLGAVAVGAALKAGTAVIIGVFPAESRLDVERALPGAPLKSVVESDERGIDELKAKLSEAMQVPARPHGPPDRRRPGETPARRPARAGARFVAPACRQPCRHVVRHYLQPP